MSTWFQIHGVFINFNSGERIKKVSDSYAGFTRYVWTESESPIKKLRINPDPGICGRGLKGNLHFNKKITLNLRK